jgi:hypothetical protein
MQRAHKGGSKEGGIRFGESLTTLVEILSLRDLTSRLRLVGCSLRVVGRLLRDVGRFPGNVGRVLQEVGRILVASPLLSSPDYRAFSSFFLERKEIGGI